MQLREKKDKYKKKVGPCGTLLSSYVCRLHKLSLEFDQLRIPQTLGGGGVGSGTSGPVSQLSRRVLFHDSAQEMVHQL